MRNANKPPKSPGEGNRKVIRNPYPGLASSRRNAKYVNDVLTDDGDAFQACAAAATKARSPRVAGRVDGTDCWRTSCWRCCSGKACRPCSEANIPTFRDAASYCALKRARGSRSPPKVIHIRLSLAHACQVWSTSVSAFVSYPVYRMTGRTIT